jgi:hypothetical protein
MASASITLKITNLKELKLGYGQPNYYLVYHTVSQ